jgi:hypothetical protein
MPLFSRPAATITVQRDPRGIGAKHGTAAFRGRLGAIRDLLALPAVTRYG